MNTKRRSLHFRLFISSTFSDYDVEREALQNCVFPDLRHYCSSLGAVFEPVDLRWGVNTEAALDHQTMDICLSELKRCQQLSPIPNFLVLLGQRYGWCPLPLRITKGTFDEILEHIPKEKHALLTGNASIPEWRHGFKPLRSGWYRLDENSIPPEYRLQSRKVNTEGLSKADRDELHQQERDDWSKIEACMFEMLLQAIHLAGWSKQDKRRMPFEQSATHQEIEHGALQVVNADKHVLAYFREINRCHRDAGRYIDEEAAVQTRLQQLKDRLRAVVPDGNRADFTLKSHQDVRPGGRYIQTFCERVTADLKRLIKAEVDAFSALSPFQLEAISQREFGMKRAALFHGREEELQRIQDYCQGDSRQPLLIYGPGGIGKSALIAKACQQVQARAASNWRVVTRFVGATPESVGLESMFESVSREVALEPPPDNGAIADRFINMLGEFAGVHDLQIILFIDGIDQIQFPFQQVCLDWIPPRLPSTVRIVLSTLNSIGSNGELLRQAQRLRQFQNLELHRLSMGDCSNLIAELLAKQQRKLTEEQECDLRQKVHATGNPLYLQLAVNETLRWTSWSGLARGADEIPGLGVTVEGVIEDLLSRLESEANHGACLVRHALGYLACSKSGLSEDELVRLLSDNSEVRRDYLRRNTASPRRKGHFELPRVMWSRLYADLQAYLAEYRIDNVRVLNFYHRKVAETVRDRYLACGDCSQRLHRKLFFHFLRAWKSLPALEAVKEQCGIARRTFAFKGRTQPHATWRDSLPTIGYGARVGKALPFHAWRGFPFSRKIQDDFWLSPVLWKAWASTGYIYELAHDAPVDAATPPLLQAFIKQWMSHGAQLRAFPALAGQQMHNALTDEAECAAVLPRIRDSLKKNRPQGPGLCLKVDTQSLVDKKVSLGDVESAREMLLPADPMGTMDLRHCFMSMGENIGLLNVENCEIVSFKIAPKGIHRLAANTEGSLLFAAYPYRKEAFSLWDRNGNETLRAVVPFQEDESVLAAAFLDDQSVFVASTHAVRILRAHAPTLIWEHLWSETERPALCALWAGDKRARLATVSRSNMRSGARVIFIAFDALDRDATKWSLQQIDEHRTTLNVVALTCTETLACALDTDNMPILLGDVACSVGQLRQEPLSKRMVGGVWVDSHALYYHEIGSGSIKRRLWCGYGEVDVYEVGEPVHEICLRNNKAYALTIRRTLLTLEAHHFSSENTPREHLAHVVEPGPLMQLRKSPANERHLLIGSTPSLAIVPNVKPAQAKWVTPSHKPIKDASASKNQVFLLDDDNNVYCWLNSNPDTPIMSVRGANSIHAIGNHLAACRPLDLHRYEIDFLSTRGQLRRQWSNVHEVPCWSIMGVERWDPKTLVVLLSQQSTEDELEVRLQLFDERGHVKRCRLITCRNEPDRLRLAPPLLVQWCATEVWFQNMSNDSRQTFAPDAYYGQVLDVDMLCDAKAPRRVVMYLKHGALLIRYPSLDKPCFLPGVAVHTRFVIHDSNTLRAFSSRRQSHDYLLT